MTDVSDRQRVSINAPTITVETNPGCSQGTDRVLSPGSNEYSPTQQSAAKTSREVINPIYVLMQAPASKTPQNLDLVEVSIDGKAINRQPIAPIVEFDMENTLLKSQNELQVQGHSPLNRPTLFATARFGEKWDTLDFNQKTKHKFTDNFGKRNNNSIANKTVTNFSSNILSPHQTSGSPFQGLNSQPSRFDSMMGPSNCTSDPRLSSNQDDLNYSVMKLNHLTRVDPNFAASNKVRPIMFQRQAKRSPENFVVKNTYRTIDEPTKTCSVYLRRPSSAIGNKYMRKFVSNKPVQVVKLGFNQQQETKQPRKPQLPFRHEDLPRRMNDLEREGQEILSTLPPCSPTSQLSPNVTIGDAPQIEWKAENLLSPRVTSVQKGSTTQMVTDFKDSFLEEQSVTSTYLSLMNKAQQPLELEKRRVSRIEMERAYAQQRIEQLRKVAMQKQGRLNKFRRTTVQYATDTKLISECDQPFEQFKRKHLSKIQNSYQVYKPPFEPQRSFSVWNGKETLRGGLPTLRKHTAVDPTLLEDSLYVSQVIEKSEVTDSIKQSQRSIGNEYKKSKSCISRKNEKTPQIVTQDFMKEYIEMVPLSSREQKQHDQCSRSHSSGEEPASCILTARGSAIIPLHRKYIDKDDGSMGVKRRQFIVNPDIQGSPTLTLEKSIRNRSPSPKTSSDKNPGLIQGRITITTGGLRKEPSTMPDQNLTGHSSSRVDVPIKLQQRSNQIPTLEDKKALCISGEEAPRTASALKHNSAEGVRESTLNKKSRKEKQTKNVVVMSKQNQSSQKMPMNKKVYNVPTTAENIQRSTQITKPPHINMQSLDNQQSPVKKGRDKDPHTPFSMRRHNKSPTSLLGSRKVSRDNIHATMPKGLNNEVTIEGDSDKSSGPIDRSANLIIRGIHHNVEETTLNSITQDSKSDILMQPLSDAGPGTGIDNQTLNTEMASNLLSDPGILGDGTHVKAINKLQVAQILNPPIVDTNLNLSLGGDHPTNIFIDADLHKRENSEDRRLDSPGLVSKQDAASSCDETQMMAFINDQTIMTGNMPVTFVRELAQPLRQHHLQVESTQPIYTDRSYKQSKALDKTIYKKNVDRVVSRRRTNEEESEMTLGEKYPTGDRSGGSTTPNPLDSLSNNQHQQSPRDKNANMSAMCSPTAILTQNNIDQSLQIKRANLTRQENNRPNRVARGSNPGIGGAAISIPKQSNSQFASGQNTAAANTSRAKPVTALQLVQPAQKVLMPVAIKHQDGSGTERFYLFEPLGSQTQQVISDISGGGVVTGQNLSMLIKTKEKEEPVKPVLDIKSQKSDRQKNQKQNKKPVSSKAAKTPVLVNTQLDFDNKKQQKKVIKRAAEIQHNLKTRKASPSKDGSRGVDSPTSPKSFIFASPEREESSALSSPVRKTSKELPQRNERTGFKAQKPLQTHSPHFANRKKTESANDRQLQDSPSFTQQHFVPSTDQFIQFLQQENAGMFVDSKQVKLNFKDLSVNQNVAYQQQKLLAQIESAKKQIPQTQTIHYHQTVIADAKPITLSVGSQKSTYSLAHENAANFILPSTVDEKAVTVIEMNELTDDLQVRPHNFNSGLQKDLQDDLMNYQHREHHPSYSGKTSQIKRRQQFEMIKQTSFPASPMLGSAQRADTAPDEDLYVPPDVTEAITIQRMKVLTPPAVADQRKLALAMQRAMRSPGHNVIQIKSRDKLPGHIRVPTGPQSGQILISGDGSADNTESQQPGIFLMSRGSNTSNQNIETSPSRKIETRTQKNADLRVDNSSPPSINVLQRSFNTYDQKSACSAERTETNQSHR